MNCHFNGAGGGPLTDYGRALFASEIAGKPFWNSQASDDDLGETSGFFGKQNPLGDKFRPGIKTRQLFLETDPGTSHSLTRSILMQADVSLAYLVDLEQTKIIVASLGFAPTPRNNDGSVEQKSNITSHEYYFRWEYQPQFWIYTGFMDKTFGIRNPDHTSFQRATIGLGQNDQAHGIIFQYAKEKHEFFINPFLGNLQQKESLRQQGVSTLYEFQTEDKVRHGFGTLISKNEFVRLARLEGHSRWGLAPGTSVLIEMGLTDDLVLSTKKSTQGAYGLLQSMMRLVRGFNLLTVGQYYKAGLDSSHTEQFKWSLGFLYHPFQRLELRSEIVNSKTLSPDQVAESAWALQTQLHLSL